MLSLYASRYFLPFLKYANLRNTRFGVRHLNLLSKKPISSSVGAGRVETGREVTAKWPVINR
jgi:hypothetical protein